MLPRTEAGFFASANRPLGYASRLDSTRLSLSPSQAAYNAEQARLLVEFANMVKPSYLPGDILIQVLPQPFVRSPPSNAKEAS